MMDAWVASVSSFARTKCWLSQRLSDFGTSLQARYALAALSGQAHSLGPREKHAALRFMLGLPDTPRSQRVLESKETARSPTPGAASCMEGRCSTSVSRGGARAQAWRNTLYTFARARFVKGPRPHHLDTPAFVCVVLDPDVFLRLCVAPHTAPSTLCLHGTCGRASCRDGNFT